MKPYLLILFIIFTYNTNAFSCTETKGTQEHTERFNHFSEKETGNKYPKNRLNNKISTPRLAVTVACALSLVVGISVAYQKSLSQPPVSHLDELVAIPNPPSKTIIVLDFDQCLMKQHMFGKYKHCLIDDIAIKSTDFGMSNPSNLFKELLKKPNIEILIASFGRKDIIQKSLSSVLSKNDAQKIHILTPQDFGLTDGCSMPEGKNRMIEKIQTALKVDNSNIIFFDDTEENLIKASETFKGIKTQAAEPFTDEHIAKIRRFLVDISK